MRHEEPFSIVANEDVCCLNGCLFEPFHECRGDVLGTGYPAHVAFDAYPNRAERNSNAPGVCEDTRPALAHFFPAEHQVPARMNALDGIVVRPHFFHLAQVE